MRAPSIYAVYDDDVFVAVGTRHELAEQLGIAANTISQYAAPSYRNKYKHGRLFIRVEDEGVDGCQIT